MMRINTPRSLKSLFQQSPAYLEALDIAHREQFSIPYSHIAPSQVLHYFTFVPNGDATLIRKLGTRKPRPEIEDSEIHYQIVRTDLTSSGYALLELRYIDDQVYITDILVVPSPQTESETIWQEDRLDTT